MVALNKSMPAKNNLSLTANTIWLLKHVRYFALQMIDTGISTVDPYMYSFKPLICSVMQCLIWRGLNLTVF